MKRALMVVLFCAGCGPAALTVDMPLHLEEHVNAAAITGSELPANPPQAVEWRFDQPQPDWKATPLWNPPFGTPTLARTSEGLGVTLTERTRVSGGRLRGMIHVAVPAWDRWDWADVVIRARADSASSVTLVGLWFNLRQEGLRTELRPPFLYGGQQSPIVRDGAIHTYKLRVSVGSRAFRGPVAELGLWFGTDGEPGSIDLLSVSAVPKGAVYADSAHGVRAVTIGERIRRTLYVHAPARVSYRVRVPQGGRLSSALGVLGGADSVTFRVSVRAGGEDERVFAERYADPGLWAERSIDLAKFAGKSVILTLETSAGQPGTVAFWGAPTVSGVRRSDKPNVIFYVIDGGGADQMSVYGYNRRTTPNLERLAREGALFEHAYSNASWTKPSTAGFMTSLHSSVLGNVGQFDPLPPEARTMAEQFHAAGYPTAVFTSNPNAGSASGLERGVDVFRECCGIRNSASSVELHRDFWDWRDASPGAPYWVHFQTTDVHADLYPPAPFAGLFAMPGDRARLDRWDSTLDEWQSRNAAVIRTDRQFAEAGVDRRQYHNTVRSLYDEAMAHQDYQLGRFVEWLQETGQWENTLLIIAADHGIAAAGEDFLVALADSLPPGWRLWADTPGASAPIFRSSVSRIPLVFIWPGHIAGGQRFRQLVSMIDVLPTVLDLAGLPAPEILQGQSLAPLLLGRAGWQPRPVIFDEFAKDPRTGELQGRIEMIDGRWGASLWIGPPPQDTTLRRATPLLLFDVWNDPLALRLVNAEHPDLVRRYTELLQRQWEAHRLLARRFTPGGQVELTASQLETLRALGYIR